MPSATPVPAPPATPPDHGLLVALDAFKGAERWLNPQSVITYLPEGCNQDNEAFDLCEPGDFTYPAPPEVVSWKPYGVKVTERCSTFSGDTENVGRITRLLNADTERQIGVEFSQGLLAQTALLPDTDPYPNMWLQNTASDDLTPSDGAVPMTHAMACLDEYLCDNNSGQPGAIHATCQTIVHWTRLNLLERVRSERGIRYFSPLGNLVIPSPGYDGGSPEGRDPGSDDIWAYATDTPRLFLGPIQTFAPAESIDRSNNTIEMTAQRQALVEWELCRFAAIQMQLKLCGSGGS